MINTFDPDIAYSNGTTAYDTTKLPTIEELEKIVDEVNSLSPPIIYVWKGDTKLLFSTPNIPGVNPILHRSKLVDPDIAYILAGTGIVAGDRAYEVLRASGVELRWSDENIPLKGQKISSFFGNIFVDYYQH